MPNLWRNHRSQLAVFFGAIAWAILPHPGLPAASGQQDFQTRLPSFQAHERDSLQTEIMARIARTGQFEPGDLARLSRLAVLNSISMLVNVRIDVPLSTVDNGVSTAITALWDRAEEFYEEVSESPLDAATLPRAQILFEQMLTAQRQVGSTYGAFPALSYDAAQRWQAFSSLSDTMSSAMAIAEANVAASRPIPDRTLDPDGIRRQAQLLANDLVALIQNLIKADPGGGARGAVEVDLAAMLGLVQDFTRKLAVETSPRDLRESHRQTRRLMRQIEAEIVRLKLPGGAQLQLQLQWRRVRARANAISDEFGLPRVIEVAPAPRQAAAVNRKLAAQVDRTVAWVDEFLAEFGPGLQKSAPGTQFRADAARMRSQLLALRRLVIANESPEALARSVGEIEASSQRLVDRAGDIAKSIKGKDMIARFQEPARAASALRGLIAQR